MSCANLWLHGLQHIRLPCLSLSLRVQTHLYWVGDATELVLPLLSPPSPTLHLSQYQGLFQWVSSSHHLVNNGSISLSNSPSNEYSWLISFRIDSCDLLVAQETLKIIFQQQFESINSLALSLPYVPTFTSIHDYWKTHTSLYTPLLALWCLCF